MKVLQINTTYNIGSTGRIVAGIDNVLFNGGIDSYAAYGYGTLQDDHHQKIINQLDSYCHNICSRLTDGQGLYSSNKTKRFIDWIDALKPDVVHLHNLHGNYINYEILFNYLKKANCKIIWTLHDCWTFTGHCAYFDMVGCEKWKLECNNCPQQKKYPPSYFIDRSRENFNMKKKIFLSIKDKLTLVPVSNWLSGLIKDSFFSETKATVIHNGINLNYFRPYPSSDPDCYILGVAAPWDNRKGLTDFKRLREILKPSIGITLIGLSKQQLASLPSGIKGLERTNSVEELAKLYSGALAFVNTTYEDNYPTVNLESIACGTPVLTYKTGGSPESVNDCCGIVVGQGDIEGLNIAISEITNRKFDRSFLRSFAEENFNENDCFKSYLELYQQL